ncbi:histone-lysine N-methyltransferase SETDB1-B-like [Notolabrus celidotus]|uniref:histone-lysine N-methyltransferase SETDB1-B-like n=1 Tax=Notolabrus celidotus TaxID=1203425 RepID=UPI0014900258|nr:histone-lysine N-methyltransferase SETDB1-B-like [Notolabrus celidotus]
MEQVEMDMGLSDIRGSLEVVKMKRERKSSGGKYADDKTLSKKRQWEDDSDSLGVVKKALVVLTRLPDYKISALRPPTPLQFYSEDESLSTSESDSNLEPGNKSSGSDLSKLKNKRNTEICSKCSTRRTAVQNNNKIEPAPIIISTAFALCADETRNVRPDLPEQEVAVDMMVLARKKHMRWQRGKILEILTREDGRLKYKVSFEEKGKSLVSGHHIAYDNTPKLEQLYVGARVVVSCSENKFHFQTGILAELPSRKNRLRFLVFTDDHVPLYVGLPSLHLVCRPLENSLEDLPDSPHKSFMTRYLRDWPYPHLTQYKAGQNINVEFNGVQQRCEVKLVDSSLIQVVFQDDQQKEWIHRGSTRLEHMIRILKLRELEEEKNDSD